MVPPMISGRASCRASIGCVMNVRNRSGSLSLPWMTWTKPASSRPAAEEQRDVVAVVEGDLAVEAFLHPLPPRALLGSGGVRHRGFARLEPYDGHELAVVGDAVGTAQPACCGGSEGVAPFITELMEPVRVAALTLDDLDEHCDPSPPRGRPLLGGAGRRYAERMDPAWAGADRSGMGENGPSSTPRIADQPDELGCRSTTSTNIEVGPVRDHRPSGPALPSRSQESLVFSSDPRSAVVVWVLPPRR